VALLPNVVLAQSHRPQPITAPVAALWLPGTRPWLEHLPPRPRLCACGQSCQLSRSLVLVAVLPTSISFVAKRELAEQFFARILFRRLGTEFVERFDPQRGVEDTDRVRQAVRQGRSMLFFPEGTFGRAPGCGPFAWAPSWWRRRPACPWCRLGITGTRSILRAGQWFPRRGNGCGDHRRPDYAAGERLDGRHCSTGCGRAQMLECCTSRIWRRNSTPAPRFLSLRARMNRETSCARYRPPP